MSQNAKKQILVIGGGAAGLSAALEAARAGGRVVVIEAAEKVGGATARAGGVIYAAETKTQQAAGVTDTLEDLFAYCMAISHYMLEPHLVRTSTTGTHHAVPWLESLGVEFKPENLYIAGLESRPRGHKATGTTAGFGPAGGACIIAALFRAITNAGVAIHYNQRAVSLIQNVSREVIGARTADGRDHLADAVILATGGFGSSREMVDRFFPDASKFGDWTWYIGPQTNVGDGLQMGLSVGGAWTSKSPGVLIETPNFSHVVDAFTPPWVLWVNMLGERFINEMSTYCVKGNVILNQPESRCFAVFDSIALSSAAIDPSLLDPYGLGVDMESNWTKKTLEQQISRGKITRCDTIEGLAREIGIKTPQRLVDTVSKWNSDVEQGRDSVYDKDPETLVLVSTPPFYAVELRPAMIGQTGAGLRIDSQSRVLDNLGRPISNLFAAGELVGGLTGAVYPGGGISMGNAIVFGRIAGQQATSTIGLKL